MLRQPKDLSDRRSSLISSHTIIGKTCVMALPHPKARHLCCNDFQYISGQELYVSLAYSKSTDYTDRIIKDAVCNVLFAVTVLRITDYKTLFKPLGGMRIINIYTTGFFVV